jgi:polyisoprenoid-binding protein YceI
VLPVRQQYIDLSTLEGGWTLEPEGTFVEFHTKLMRVVPVKGHIKAIKGSVTVDSDGAIDAILVLDATTMDTGIKKRDAHLRTADFLDVDKYPTMIFAAQSARRYPSGQFELMGSLTLHGQSRPLTMFVEVEQTSAAVTASAEVLIDRTAWGVGRARLGLATATRVEVTARFVKQ